MENTVFTGLTIKKCGFLMGFDGKEMYSWENPRSAWSVFQLAMFD
jgi:hypothetical protein